MWHVCYGVLLISFAFLGTLFGDVFGGEYFGVKQGAGG